MIDIYRRWGDAVLALLALVIMLLVLFWGYNVGMSDQSDFGRVMDASSLTHYIHDRAFIFIDRYTIGLEDASLLSNAWRIMFSGEGIENYPSIHLLFVRLSVVANLVLNRITAAPLDVYRIGILGAATALMYAALIFWLFRQIKLKSPVADIAAKLFILFIALDVGYIAYFNSFFSESIQILAFMMIIITGIRIFKGKRGLRDFALLVFAALMFGWSKFVNIPIAFLIIAAFAVIIILTAESGQKIRRSAAIAVIALVGIVPLLLVYSSIPVWMETDTNYNSVFFGIIKDVDDATARQHLEALGLSPEMAEFASTNRYVDGVGRRFYEMGFEEEFAQISKLDLLWFYLRHPALLWANIEMSVAHSGMIRPWYIANYGHNADRLTLSDRFSGWSWLRMRMAFDTIWGNIALWALFAAGIVIATWTRFSAKERQVPMILLITILGSAAYSLVVQIVANGEADLAKHMFVYIQFVDLAFALMVVGLIAMLSKEAIKYRLCKWVAIAAVVILFVPLPISAARSLWPVSVVDVADAGVGDVVSFGRFNNQELLWLIVDETAETQTLFAIQNVAEMPFDSANSSFWPDSDIRQWLNDDFLHAAFSETDRIIYSERYLMLSIRNRHLAEAGDRDFYAFHIPRYAFRGADRAYRMMAADAVRLPGPDVMQQLHDMGAAIHGGYWLELPRFLDGEMPRYVTHDGFVTMRDASALGGVRPVITIRR